jgi:hypothetical protein
MCWCFVLCFVQFVDWHASLFVLSPPGSPIYTGTTLWLAWHELNIYYKLFLHWCRLNITVLSVNDMPRHGVLIVGVNGRRRNHTIGTSHYRKPVVCWVSGSLPSVFDRALSKQPFCWVPNTKHSANVKHSTKWLFAECLKFNTGQTAGLPSAGHKTLGKQEIPNFSLDFSFWSLVKTCN